MARRQSTSDARARRNRPASVGSQWSSSSGVMSVLHRGTELRSPTFWDPDSIPTSIEQAIEHERGRLYHAESVLHCLRAALVHSEASSGGDPGYAEVADIVLRLIRESVHRLDSIYLKASAKSSRRKALGGKGESSASIRKPALR